MKILITFIIFAFISISAKQSYANDDQRQTNEKETFVDQNKDGINDGRENRFRLKNRLRNNKRTPDFANRNNRANRGQSQRSPRKNN